MAMPSSNAGGNNQTSPGVGGMQPIAQLPFQGPAQMGSNPFFNSAPTGTPSPSSPALPTSGPVPIANTGGTSASSLQPTSGSYPTPTVSNPLITNNSSYSSGQNDLEKQLIDMFGKGVGGSLFTSLAGMGGENSAIFKQFLDSMGPLWAQQKASLGQGLGSAGVSANSSVNAIGQATLAGQQQATAAGVNANLMEQEMQDTLNVLTGMQAPAAKEVATSGWSVFADVMNNITGDIGNLMGGNYQSPEGQKNNAPTPNTGPGQLPSFNPAAGDSTNYNDPSWGGLNTGSPDLSIFAGG